LFNNGGWNFFTDSIAPVQMNRQDKKLVGIVEDTIKKSANELLASKEADFRVNVEKGRDIKLEADLLLNKKLTEQLSSITDIRCMSEEDLESHGMPNGDSFWIVDPLDGSMNFSRRIPLYCISVALWRDGKPVIGVVYDLERKQTFSACYSTAMVDNQPIRVGQIETPEEAILATGFPVLTDFSERSLKWIVSFTKRFKKIRMLGTAALSLAWVAEGKLDVYFEQDIMIWDVAAGLAMVEGAGGSYLMLPGRHPNSFNVLAGNHNLMIAMRDEVKKSL
jgi:myo-inositol-1(or 4)-monophosphatase